MKITNITKVGDTIKIEVDELPGHVFKLLLRFIKDKQDLLQQLKKKIAPSLKDKTIQEENDLKYNEWVKQMIGDTIA